MVVWANAIRRCCFIFALIVLTTGRKKKLGCSKDLEFDDLITRGNSFQEQNRLSDAAKCFELAASERPNVATAWVQLSMVLMKTGNLARASQILQDALVRISSTDPRDLALLWSSLAKVFEAENKAKAADEAYQRVTELVPTSELAWYNLGYHRMTQYQYELALPAFAKAVDLNPSFGRAHEGVGAIYFGNGEEEKAVPYFKRAAELMPDQINARLNYANALGKVDRSAEAVPAYRAVLALDPNHADALCKLLYFSLHSCDWSDYNHLVRRVLSLLQRELQQSEQSLTRSIPIKHTVSSLAKISGPPTTLIPFNALLIPISPADQLRLARTHASKHLDAFRASNPPATLDLDGEAKLQVAYLSADFRNHPMGRDLSVLLLAHDPARTRAHCFAQNPPHAVHDGGYRARLAGGVASFHEVNPLSDDDAAAAVRSVGAHVLVDLMGYTHGARDGVLARRPAELIVGFKGYMSTSGAPWLTHMILDPVALPPELSVHHSERGVYLYPIFAASTHAVNHPELLTAAAAAAEPDRLPPARLAQERVAAGLPPAGFLFCSFNTLYKVSPTIFNAWMDILGHVPHSFLWLLNEPPGARPRLCRAAAARGVGCERLVVTDKADLTKHLLVKRLADLFLDTPLYNGHSTMADVLWAGVPVVTLPREKMAARVGASLAAAHGLGGDMTARTLSDYVSLAVTLARRPAALRRLRRRLRERRAAAAGGGVFDVKGWMRAYEAGLRLALETRRLPAAAAAARRAALGDETPLYHVVVHPRA